MISGPSILIGFVLGIVALVLLVALLLKLLTPKKPVSYVEIWEEKLDLLCLLKYAEMPEDEKIWYYMLVSLLGDKKVKSLSRRDIASITKEMQGLSIAKRLITTEDTVKAALKRIQAVQ